MIINHLKGENVLGNAGGNAPAAQPTAPAHKSMGSAVTDAEKGTMTSYGERLAERATPDMNAV